jgi:hypothetical protein
MPPAGYSKITPLVLDKICRRIARGRTIRDVCKDKDIPSYEALYDAMSANPAVADAVARARLDSAHALADEVIAIADSSDNPAMANLLRNRCDQRRWLAGKFNPMYADKHMVEHRQHADTTALGYEELMALAMAKAPHLTIEHDAGPQQDAGTTDADDV